MNRILTILLCLFLSTLTINAATLTVSKNADTNDGVCDADCSLREAIDVATSGDTIEFSSFFNTTQFITLSGTELIIDKSLTINGTGADKLNIDANFSSRVISVSGIGNVVTINDLRIAGGFNTSAIDCNGGGIKITDAIVNINKSVIDSNFTNSNAGNPCFGGGIFNLGVLNLSNSTISNNFVTSTAAALGGGIHNGSLFTSATANILNSTISGNVAMNGGGINNGQTLLLTGVTITNNQSNGVNTYAGINNGFLSATTIRSTIIAGNLNNRDAFGNFTSQGFNLIGDGSGTTGITQATDQLGNTAIPINAMLGTLASNGGTTPTHSLMPASPAIDKGNGFGSTIDQRGQNRVIDISSVANAIGGDAADIGAFERLAPTAAGVSIKGRVMSANGRGLGNIIIELADLSGNNKFVRTNNFGHFTFTDTEVGQTYIVNAFAKQYQFAPQVINPTENITNLTFRPNTQNSLKKRY